MVNWMDVYKYKKHDFSARGKTIVATLHQPSSELFALFDRILLMAEGRVAFMGTTSQACTFFET